MNELIKHDDSDPFDEYYKRMQQRFLVGNMLKFNKGDWVHGTDSAELRQGTRLVANVFETMVGWVKWDDDKRPSEHVMGRIYDRFVPPKRKDLGDNDSNQWRVDDDGRARDPWQFTNYLLLKRPGATDGGSLFTFTTASKGGIGAVTDLIGQYKALRRQHQDHHPIVELLTDSYNHSNRSFGRVKVPKFHIVGWEHAGLFAQALGANATTEPQEIKAEEPVPARIVVDEDAFDPAVAWAQVFMDHIKQAATKEEVNAWIKANEDVIDQLKEAGNVELVVKLRNFVRHRLAHLDVPPKPPLRGQPPMRKSAMDASAPRPKPDFTADPTKAFDWINWRLNQESTIEGIQNAWNNEIVESVKEMFPPDRKEANNILLSHDRRVSQ